MRHLIVLCVLQGSRSFFEFDVEKDEKYALLEFLLTKMKKSTVGTWNNESNITPDSNWKSWNSCGMKHVSSAFSGYRANCIECGVLYHKSQLFPYRFCLLAFLILFCHYRCQGGRQPKSFPLKCDCQKKYLRRAQRQMCVPIDAVKWGDGRWVKLNGIAVQYTKPNAHFTWTVL